jgi:hypothetical protein
LDLFHIEYLVNFVPITLFFALGTALENLHLFSLPCPYLVTVLGIQLLPFTLLSMFTSLRTPVRLSSLPVGEKLRSPVYTIVEDIVAVNGGGGASYRRALNERYVASPVFRRLMDEMGLFWGVGSLIVGTVLIILLATIDVQVAYGLAWGVPSVWAATSTLATFWWVKRRLMEERETWSAA